MTRDWIGPAEVTFLLLVWFALDYRIRNLKGTKMTDVTDRELMQQALEALERCVATCFDAYAHEQVMSKPEHFVNQSITALRERLAQQQE